MQFKYQKHKAGWKGKKKIKPKDKRVTKYHFVNPYRPFLEAAQTENYFVLWMTAHRETISKVLPSSWSIFFSIFCYKLPRIIMLGSYLYGNKHIKHLVFKN